jgi:mevalonate pyrophosphate decarboxylase
MRALRTVELNYDAQSDANFFADGFLLASTDSSLYAKAEFLKLIADNNNPLELFSNTARWMSGSPQPS